VAILSILIGCMCKAVLNCQPTIIKLLHWFLYVRSRPFLLRPFFKLHDSLKIF